jgi:nucleoside-diphosphate-sugar epimerase
MNKILFVGFGYVASHFYKTHKNSLSQTLVLSRTNPDEKNIQWLDLLGEILISDKDIDHIFITIPPHENEEKIVKLIADYYRDNQVKTITYLSATSVYGDHNGEWVDEDSALLTKTSSGKKRLESEKLWRSKLPQLNILRLAGIYGPKRSVIDRLVRSSQKNILKPGHFFSRVHVDDIVHIMMKVCEEKVQNQIFNLADDMPSEQSLVVEYAAEILGVATPKPIMFDLAKKNMSEKMLEFYSENKKVSNNKVKNYFKYSFSHPSFRLGLNSILKENDR